MVILLAILSISFTVKIKKPTKHNYRKYLSFAQEYFDEQNYVEAIKIYKMLLEIKPSDYDVLMNVGLSYLNMANKSDSAIIFFNKALDTWKDKDLYSEEGVRNQLFLAKALQFSLRPEEAIKKYETILLNADNLDDELHKEIEREIITCNNERFLLKNPVKINIENLGNNVNSEYDDHSPIISVLDNNLFFTSRRQNKALSLLQDGQYPEKVYTINLNEKNKEKAKLLKIFFKRYNHESAVSLSPDGKTLVLFGNDRQGQSLYYSKYDDGNWSDPIKFPEPINSPAEETHGSISADNNTIFFTSNREGGYGGLDIYMSTKDENGNWGKAVNLGPNINTKYDEETPMIHYDGQTLYFASEGHNSMGRLDLFYSSRNADNTWSLPVNLGYPINTPDDDFFFVPTLNRSKAYFASAKNKGFGRSDIYFAHFEDVEDTELAVVEGTIDSSLGEDYGSMRILVTRNKDNKSIGNYRPNANTGKYIMFLEAGHEYKIEQKNKEDETKTLYANVLSKMDYEKTRTPVILTEIAMDTPLVPLVKQDKLEASSLILMKSKRYSGKIKSDNKDAENTQTEVNNNENIVESEENNSIQDTEKTNLKTNSNLEVSNSNNTDVKKSNIIENKEESNSELFEGEKEEEDKDLEIINEIKLNLVTDKKDRERFYTIQVIALRKGVLKDPNYFTSRGVKRIELHKGKDGYARYCYGNFKTYKEALKKKQELLSVNKLTEAWIRKYSDYYELDILE